MEWAQWVFVVVLAIRAVGGLVGLGMALGGHKIKPRKSQTFVQQATSELLITALLATFLYLAGAFSHIL